MQHARIAVAVFTVALAAASSQADPPRALPDGQAPADARLGPLRTLDGYFPMTPVADADDWPTRRAQIRSRILVAAGLHPMPQRTPLNPVVHGKVERDDYTVERVILESFPGHFVTGSLYRPKAPAPAGQKRPAVLCPHGHWSNGRFHDHGPATVRSEIVSGAERFVAGGRHPLQARCVQLARMGCVVFLYDMEGYADSVQLPHRAGVRDGDPSKPGHLFFSVDAELRGQTMFGLQTWNSVRAVDFIESLPDVDPDRIAVTGGSGGGTQTMILAAIDDRIDAAFPAVMVSTAMQGGCTCENAPHLRIGQGNIDIAAATAPRPLGLIAADDWTKELETKGHPDLLALYKTLNHPERYEAHFHLQFKHNYNAMNRRHLYAFIDRHFDLGLDAPIIERDYDPLDTATEATVWTDAHPKPTGDAVGEAHERTVTAAWTRATDAAYEAMSDDERRRVIGEGVEVIVGRTPGEVGPVEWELVEKANVDGVLVMAGTLTVKDHGEQLPALFIYPKENWNRQVVIGLADDGKHALLEADGKPIAQVAALVERGFAVASVDMLGQGEFNGAGVKIGHYGNGDQPWQQAACYTFGYNASLFARRVHDVMSLVEFIRHEDEHRRTERIHLVAIGEQAGPVALAARYLLGDRIDKAAVDTAGFGFDFVTRFDHPMFVPGIALCRGVEGLWTLNGPLKTARVDGPDGALQALQAAPN